jgi:hypothetical protein
VKSLKERRKERKKGCVPFTISQSFQHLNNIILFLDKQLSTREVGREILRLSNRIFEVTCLKEKLELVNFNLGTACRSFCLA